VSTNKINIATRLLWYFDLCSIVACVYF